jgi:hypothetical protein
MKVGGRLELWYAMQKQVGEFINANKIAPMNVGAQQEFFTLGAMALPVTTPTAKTATTVKDSIWWHGGMKAAHLHWEGRIYPLAQDQWNEFAKQTLGVFAKKLAAAKSISFDKVASLSEAVAEFT